MRDETSRADDRLHQPGDPVPPVARRMAGQDDGSVDAMFKISRPATGACFWCPPMRAGRLALRRLGLGA